MSSRPTIHGRRHDRMVRPTTHAILAVLLLMISAMLLVFVPAPVAADPIIHQTFPADNVTMMEGETAVFVVELEPNIDISKAIVQWYKGGSPVTGIGLSYTFAPDFNGAGKYEITIIIVYNATTATHIWNVTVLEVKQKFSVQTWVPSGDTIVRELSKTEFSCMVKNPANDTLTYRWFIDNELQLGHNASSFIYSPGLDGAGGRRVRLVVESIDHTEEGIWNVMVSDALEVSPEGPQTIREGDSLTFTVRAPDITEANIHWSIDVGANPVANGKSFVYNPDYSSAGTHTIKMTNTEGLDYTWTIKVDDVDRAPVIDQGRLIKAQAGQTVKLKTVATDPDNDIVKYEWDFEGDGTFEAVSDRDDVSTHNYKKPGTYLATYKVTDAHGETAMMIYPVLVTSPTTMSPWTIGSIVLGVIIIVVVVWIVTDISKARKRARLEADARAQEEAAIRAKAKARAESERAARAAAARKPKRQELPVFEDIPEPAQGKAEDYSMTPYQSKMADRGGESEGAAAEGELAHPVEGEGAEGSESPTSDIKKAAEKEELDDLLKTLAVKSGTKADLKAKKASAEAGAEDIDHDAIGPAAPGAKGKMPKHQKKPQMQKKAPKKEAKEELRGGSGKGADSDIDSQASDEVDEVMQRLVDMGLAERKKK